MAKVNSDELHAYIAGTIGPVRAREIERQAESDEELKAALWLLRGLYDSNDDIESLKSVCRDVPAPDAVPQFAGRYELTNLCGQGSISEVWLASDMLLGRQVAIKILRAEHCGIAEIEKQFYRETLISGQLQHPGILLVHESGRLPDQRPYFAMKFVRGQTLAELLAKRSSPRDGLQHFVTLFKQVCETVAYAHSKGIIHRDLKPSNVMVGQFGEVQVMDWGLAKVLDGDSAEPTIDSSKLKEMDSSARAAQGAARFPSTQVGVAIGTWEFMPPEQARGLACQADERSDVFALGAFLCAILTGKPPYVGHTKEEVMRQAREADLAGTDARLDACGADADLIKLAKRCLAEKPDDRPRDASKVATAVAEYMADVEERAQKAKVAQAVAEEKAARLAEEKAEAERKARKQAEKARRIVLRLMAGLTFTVLALLAASLFAWRAHVAALDAERDREAEKRQHAIDRALTAAMGGDLEGAEQAIAEAEQAGASTGQVRMLRGQIALHRGQSQEAMRHLEQAVRLLPDSVAAWGMLASAYAWDGHWERYDQALREMAKLTPSTPEDFLFKGYAEANLEPSRGLQTIKKAFDRRPMTGIALLLRADVRALVAQDTDDLKEAEGAVQDASFAKEVLRNNPAALWVSLEAHGVKAGVHEHRGEQDKRWAELELARKDAKALKDFTALPEAVVYRWLYFREVGRAEEVLEELRLASERTDHVYVTFCYALTLYRRGQPGDFEEALRVLKKKGRTYNDRLLPFVLAEHDYHQHKRDWRARARKASEDFAARVQDEAAVMDTQSVLCLFGEKQEAVKACQELQKRPARFYTLRSEALLACLRYNAGDLPEKKFMQGAEGSRWNQCLAHYYIAMTKLAEGDREGAQEHFDKAVKTRAFLWGSYDISWVFLDRLAKDPTWPPWIPKKRGK
jgi:tetratricopeptide (TPR) repeat protein